MALTFGYSKTVGWMPATGPLVLADLQARYVAETQANADVDNGPPADMLRTVAQVNLQLWQDAEGTYNSHFTQAAPGTNGVAEGSSLELLLTSKIGPKQAAAESVVTLPLFAVAGPDVNVPANSTVTIVGETGAWLITAPVLIPGGGTIDGDFEYFETGAKQAIAATTWEIGTPVTGWASVGPNVADAIQGRDFETDAEYRARYTAALTDNLVAEVGQVEGVTSVTTIEHPSSVPDGFWGLTHWVELLVVGGDTTAIGEAIQRARAKGVATVGNTTVSITNANYVGGAVEVKLSRPTGLQTHVEITVVPGQDYPTDNSLEAIGARVTAITVQAQAHFALLAAGDSTSGFKIGSYVESNAGIQGIDNLVVKVDLIDPPVNTGVLTPQIRQLLTLSTADIDVIGA